MAKKYNSTKNKKKNLAKPWSWENWIAVIYIMVMFGFFPLFYRNNYINIMESKWLAFMVSTLVAVSCVVFSLVCNVLGGKYKLLGTEKKKFMEIVKMPDIFLAILMFSVLVSWWGAAREDYLVEAWDGSMGKMAGVFFYLILILAYLIVSRLVVFNNFIVSIYLLVNFIVFTLAILNHFMIDPLHMYENLAEEQYWMFCSTMGNINVLSGYFCIFVPITVVTFCFAKDLYSKLVYGLVMTVSFMGTISANSDAGILGVGASFVFVLWFCFDNWDRLYRFFLAMFIFFASAAFIGYLDNKHAETVKDVLETLPSFVANSVLNRIGLLLCLVLGAVCFMVNRKYSDRTEVLKKIRIVVYVLLGIAVVSAFGIFLYFSVIDTDKDLGTWSTYLRFSDMWGSSRGFTWKRVMWLYGDYYTFFQKIFGCGPDLMVVPLHTYFDEEIFAKMGAYLVDAHSEFFQTLGTLGLLGVIGYLGFEISALLRVIRNWKKEPFLLAIAAAAVAYMVQGMMGSPQTFSTPMLFLMLALGEAIIKNIKDGQITGAEW